MSTPEPVRRSHHVPGAAPAQAYAVVTDFAAYPRLFPEFTSVRVLETDGNRRRVEFNAQVVIAARYVLDLVCDEATPAVDWTFVEGNIVTSSVGNWRFTADGQGTRIDYTASLEVKAPLPGFILRKVSDALVAAALPSMFASITREITARRSARP